MAGEVGAALLHLDENDGPPDTIGEGRAAAVFGRLLESELRLAAGFQETLLRKGPEEAVEKDLGFAFFIAADVTGDPIDKTR